MGDNDRRMVLEVVRECADLRQRGGRMLEVVTECADLRRWKHQTLQAEGTADGWHCRRIVMQLDGATAGGAATGWRGRFAGG